MPRFLRFESLVRCAGAENRRTHLLFRLRRALNMTDCEDFSGCDDNTGDWTLFGRNAKGHNRFGGTSSLPILLKDLTAAELHAGLSHIGVTPRQARQIHAAAVRRGVLPTANEGIAAKLLQEVRRMHGDPEPDAGRETGLSSRRIRQVPLSSAMAPSRSRPCEFRCCTDPMTSSTSSASARKWAAPWAANSAPLAGWGSAATWRHGRSSTRSSRFATTRRIRSAASFSWAWASRCSTTTV